MKKLFLTIMIVGLLFCIGWHIWNYQRLANLEKAGTITKYDSLSHLIKKV